jgi:hypothetical protein
MWNEPPNLRTTTGKLKETIRVLLAVLTSPLCIAWMLVTGKSKLVPMGFAYLFSPLVFIWVLSTRRELYVYIGSLVYKIGPVSGPGTIRSSALIYSTRKGTPRPLPRWRLGPIEISLEDQFSIRDEDQRLITRGRVIVKLFARGDERSYRYGFKPGHMSSVPIGPVEIGIMHYNPTTAVGEAPRVPPKLPDCAEVVSMATMPVYGLVGTPLGLALTLYGATDQGPAKGEAHEAHRVFLHFENHPLADEDPARTASQVYLYNRKQQEEEMRRLVQTHKLPARWLLVGNDSPGVAPDYPPLPTKALYLDSFDDYLETSSGNGIHREVEDQILETRFKMDPAFATLFTSLPLQVRSGPNARHGKQLCAPIGDIARSYVPDILPDIAASGARNIARQIVIGGKEFEGQLLYWPHKYPLCSFHLEHQENADLVYRLEGATFGMTFEQLDELLGGLVPINARPELVAQYQAEHDEHERELQERIRPRP